MTADEKVQDKLDEDLTTSILKELLRLKESLNRSRPELVDFAADMAEDSVLGRQLLGDFQSLNTAIKKHFQ